MSVCFSGTRRLECNQRRVVEALAPLQQTHTLRSPRGSWSCLDTLPESKRCRQIRAWRWENVEQRRISLSWDPIQNRSSALCRHRLSAAQWDGGRVIRSRIGTQTVDLVLEAQFASFHDVSVPDPAPGSQCRWYGYLEHSNYRHFLPVCGECVCVC